MDCDLSVAEEHHMKGSRTQSGLYMVNLPVEGYKNENTALFSANTEQNLKNWHSKMGHMSMTKLKQLPNPSNGIEVKTL